MPFSARQVYTPESCDATAPRTSDPSGWLARGPRLAPSLLQEIFGLGLPDALQTSLDVAPSATVILVSGISVCMVGGTKIIFILKGGDFTGKILNLGG